MYGSVKNFLKNRNTKETNSVEGSTEYVDTEGENGCNPQKLGNKALVR